MLRLPRADEFEPLAGPLREFARVSPALTGSLSQVLRIVRPLSEAIERLDGMARNLTLAQASLETRHELPAPPTAFDAHAAARCIEHARVAILEALASLPRDREYGRLAAHLRELAYWPPAARPNPQRTKARKASG